MRFIKSSQKRSIQTNFLLIHTYIHTYIHIYIHTYIHTYVQFQSAIFNIFTLSLYIHSYIHDEFHHYYRYHRILSLSLIKDFTNELMFSFFNQFFNGRKSFFYSVIKRQTTYVHTIIYIQTEQMFLISLSLTFPSRSLPSYIAVEMLG